MENLCRCNIADVDIAKPLVRSYAGMVLATGDSNANRFGVNINREGEPIDLAGCTVKGYFIRPSMDTLVIDGAVDVSTAYVDLSAACYTANGSFSLAIKIEGEDVNVTVRVIDGYIRLTQTDTIADPDEKIHSLPELLAMVDELESTTKEAQGTLSEINESLSSIEEAVENASAAVESAENAVADAKNAVAEVEGMTVSATAGAAADAQISTVDGKKHIAFTLPKGDKGDRGDPGYTPVRGKDYWTEDDQEAITEEVSNQLSEEMANNPLRGKKVSFLGDSICAGSNESTSYLGGYGKIIADRNGMVYENVAHAGATVTAETYSRSTGNPKPWLCRMIENMSADADYAIIEGGLNDGWEENLTIGQMSSGYNAVLDDTTYYGAFESMLKQLVTRFKGKKIGYIAVPKIHSLYDSEQNIPNFYHIAMECCAKWGVPVCDLNTISPPVEYLKTFGDTYTADGTHPTYEGYLRYYCDPVEAWMKTLTTGGNSAAGMVLKAVDSATKEMNASIAALQTGKLNNTGVSFRRALLNLADGTTVEIDVLTAVDGTAVVPYVNRMPISVDADGSVYNGVGWKGNTRLSASSGSVNENTNFASIIGFIPVRKGDIGRFKFSAPSTCWDGNNINSGWNIIAYYDSSYKWLGSVCPLQNGGQRYGICTTSDFSSGSVANGGIVSFTVPANDNIAYVRLSMSDVYSEGLANLIVTINEEIK